MARPTKYTDQLAEDIIVQIMDGLSVAEIGRKEDMPDKSTIFRWIASNDVFCDKYMRAKDICADQMVDDMLDIADDGSNDWMERLDKDGNAFATVLNGEHVQRSRLRIETRKWIASKLKPKKYGDKLDVDHGGNINVNIVKFNADNNDSE